MAVMTGPYKWNDEREERVDCIFVMQIEVSIESVH